MLNWLTGVFSKAHILKKGVIPSLDGARGVAVLMVLLDHASGAGLRLFPGADLNRLGKYGVYLFFVLSAFLLTYPFWLGGPDRIIQPRVWANYFLRRFLRVFPPFALVIGYYWLDGNFDTSTAINHMLLREGAWHFWTIPVEIKYYFALPVVVFVFAYAMRKNWLFGLLSFAAGFLFMEYIFFPLEEAWYVSGEAFLDEAIPPFLFGSAAGLIFGLVTERKWDLRRFAILFEVVAIGTLIATVIRIPPVFNALFPSDDPVSKFGDDTIVCGALWSAFILAHLWGTGFTRRIFESAALRYVGLVSYSAYLWHRKFLRDVDDLPLPPQLSLLAFVLLVLAVASVSYFLMERPLSRIRLRSGRTDEKALPVPIPADS